MSIAERKWQADINYEAQKIQHGTYLSDRIRPAMLGDGTLDEEWDRLGYYELVEIQNALMKYSKFSPPSRSDVAKIIDTDINKKYVGSEKALYMKLALDDVTEQV